MIFLRKATTTAQAAEKVAPRVRHVPHKSEMGFLSVVLREQIDGASELRMFFQIAMPACKPIFAVIARGRSAAHGESFLAA